MVATTLPGTFLVDDEFATLSYVPEMKLIRHRFHKPICGAPFRSMLNRGVEALTEYNSCKWLSDDRENHAFPEDDNIWIFNDWIPRALAAGWKYWALVVPEDIAARGNMSTFIPILFEKGLRMMVFTNTESALAWINAM
jgi:hypothetical protein